MLSRKAKHLAIDAQILRFAQNDSPRLRCDEALISCLVIRIYLDLFRDCVLAVALGELDGLSGSLAEVV
jgi:hypothetical protein